jgi:signal transduction histidine kinase
MIYAIMNTEEIVNNCNIANSNSLTNAQKTSQNENELNESTLSFLSRVSHDLRSPLTTIQSSTEILESFSDRLSAEEKEKHFQTVYDSISNLSQLLDDVTMFCQADINAIIPKYEKIEIISCSEKIIGKITTSFSKSPQINFYPKIEELNISTDKKLFSQILSNLISNAIKYTPSNRNVDVSITQLNGEVILEIRDYGIGIPENERSKIFIPFFGARATKNTAGSGLGLAIVQQAVKILEGKISFISHEKRGNMFTVKIPVNGGEE